MGQLHLIKLCVGIDSVEDLIASRPRATRKGAAPRSRHVTRMWPKRADELLQGGSLYWVIRGAVQARQSILSLDEAIGQDGIRRCAIALGPEVIRTASALRRPFQGWRYLSSDDAPPDLRAQGATDSALPPELSAALAEIGVR